MADRSVKLVGDYYLVEIEHEDNTFEQMDSNKIKTQLDRIKACKQIYEELVKDYKRMVGDN